MLRLAGSALAQALALPSAGFGVPVVGARMSREQRDFDAVQNVPQARSSSSSSTRLSHCNSLITANLITHHRTAINAMTGVMYESVE
jgi:hypothetical protein